MKKVLNSITLTGKIILLFFLLLVGWVYLNVNNFLKGKNAQNNSLGNLVGPEDVYADAPDPDPTPSP